MKRYGRYKRIAFCVAAGLFILLALPWYATMLAIHGSTYVTIAQSQTVGRFMAPMEGHGFGFFFYVPVLLLGFFPWSGLLPMALHQVYANWRSSRTAASGSDSQPSAQNPDSPAAELELFAALNDVQATSAKTLVALADYDAAAAEKRTVERDQFHTRSNLQDLIAATAERKVSCGARTGKTGGRRMIEQ